MTHPVAADASLFAQNLYFNQVHHAKPLSSDQEVALLAAYQQAHQRFQTVTHQLDEAKGRLMAFTRLHPRSDASPFEQAIKQYEREIASLRLTEQTASAPLVEAYQPLVLNVARRYLRRDTAMDLMDLVQEGNTGLLQALVMYDPATHAGFSTFAFICIRGAITSALWQGDGLIRLPDHKARALRRLDQVEARLCVTLARTPIHQELAEAMGVDLASLRELLVLRMQQIMQLDTVLVEGEDLKVADVVAEVFNAPRDAADLLHEAIATLTPFEQAYIRKRYGVDGESAVSQAQMARSLGLNRSQVERLEHRIRRQIAQFLAQAVA